jgi:hypothetical protein
LPTFRFIIQVSGFSIQLICFSSIGSIRMGNKLRLRGPRWRGANFIRLTIDDGADGD